MFSADLQHLVYSSFIGGSGTTGFGDRGRSLVLLPDGRCLIGGDTNSPDFPVSTHVYSTAYSGGDNDGFVSIENPAATRPFGSGKTNSLGLEPRLNALGSPRAMLGQVTLRVTDAVPLRSGIFAYGHSLIASPYQGGTLYMGPPIVRMPPTVVTDVVGQAQYAQPIVPSMVGSTRIVQFWYRDPAHPDGTGAGLSNAVKITFVP